MIDVIREIEAVQREVGSRRIPAGEARDHPPAPRLRRADRGRLGRADQPRAHRPLVPADQRRLPPRRALPVRGQRRAARSSPASGRTGSRSPGSTASRASDADVSEVEVRLTPAGDEATTLELEHVAIVPDEMWDQFGPGRRRRRLGRRRARARAAPAGRLARATRIAWQLSPEGVEFYTRSSEAWGAANRGRRRRPRDGRAQRRGHDGVLHAGPERRVVVEEERHEHDRNTPNAIDIQIESTTRDLGTPDRDRPRPFRTPRRRSMRGSRRSGPPLPNRPGPRSGRAM